MKTTTLMTLALAMVGALAACEVQNHKLEDACTTCTTPDAGSGQPAPDATVAKDATCVPSCGGGKMCGDNGCGGECGTCGSNQLCSAGTCIAKATPADAGSNPDIVSPDVQQPKPDVTAPSTCEGRCGAAYNKAESCQCDSECTKNSDCCSDYASKCSGEFKCANLAACQNPVMYYCGQGVKAQKYKVGMCKFGEGGKQFCVTDGATYAADSLCDDGNPSTTDNCTGPTSKFVTDKEVTCSHTPTTAPVPTCPAGQNWNSQTGKCEQTQAASTTTDYPSDWYINAGDDLVSIQVWQFATNTFGVKEMPGGYKLIDKPVVDHIYKFQVLTGVGAVCINTMHKPAGGKVYWVPGQNASGQLVQKATQEVWGAGMDYWKYGSLTMGPKTPECKADVVTEAGCSIGKVYNNDPTDTDNWNCFVPSGWGGWCGL